MYSCIYIKYVIMLIVIVVVDYDYCLGIFIVVCRGLILMHLFVCFLLIECLRK